MIKLSKQEFYWNFRKSYKMSVFQLVQWSWTVLSSLWWRETTWLWAAEPRRLPPTSQLISIKMDVWWRAALQDRWSSTESPSLMKDSTSVSCLMLENHHRAGWLSEVKLCTTSHSSSQKCFLMIFSVSGSLKSTNPNSDPLVFAAVDRETCPCSDQSSYVLLLLRTVFTMVMVALLLLLVGLLHCGKLPRTHK